MFVNLSTVKELGLVVGQPRPHTYPGCDIVITLHPHLRTASLKQAAELFSLALAYARDARSVYVRGGIRTVRESVATVLGTALNRDHDLVVFWDPSPKTGPQLAPGRTVRHG